MKENLKDIVCTRLGEYDYTCVKKLKYKWVLVNKII